MKKYNSPKRNVLIQIKNGNFDSYQEYLVAKKVSAKTKEELELVIKLLYRYLVSKN